MVWWFIRPSCAWRCNTGGVTQARIDHQVAESTSNLLKLSVEVSKHTVLPFQLRVREVRPYERDHIVTDVLANFKGNLI